MRYLLVISLLACSFLSYGANKAPSYPTIQGYSDALFMKKLYIIGKVNHSSPRGKWSENSPIKLRTNSKNSVSGYVFLKNGMFSKGIYVKYNHVFFARSGEHYHIKAHQNGNRITTWVVDSRNQAVTRKITKEALKQGETLVDVPELQR